MSRFFVSYSNGEINENKVHIEDSNSFDKNVSPGHFSISVNPTKVEAILDEMTNFTIAINKSHWEVEELEVMYN